MKQKIIFFDIDRTLFKLKIFMDNFYNVLIKEYNFNEENILKIIAIQKNVKIERGYFSPSLFLSKIYNLHPSLDGELDYYFKPKNLTKYLYEDSDNLLKIVKLIRIGIFSKGDYEYQYSKIDKYKNIILNDNIHIFPNKIKEIKNTFSMYTDFEIIVVDDEIEILEAVKNYNKEIFSILIDREKKMMKNDRINARIEDLSSIGDYL